jgi:aryl-alcohol dehydrogenase-like predicted oxidoreductase
MRTRTRHLNGSRPLSRHGGAGAEAEIFQAIDQIRVLADKTGIPMAQLATHWAAHQPGITCAIAGVRSVAQLQEALAGVNLTPPSGVMQQLTEITEPVKQKLGGNADYFQSSENGRVH